MQNQGIQHGKLFWRLRHLFLQSMPQLATARFQLFRRYNHIKRALYDRETCGKRHTLREG